LFSGIIQAKYKAFDSGMKVEESLVLFKKKVKEWVIKKIPVKPS
jgi:hypothetical protein